MKPKIIKDGAKNLVEFCGVLLRESEKAYQIATDSVTCWLPKSKTEHDKESGLFLTEEWLAKEKGVI